MKPPRKLDADELWDYAVRVLGARAHSTGELTVKLRNRAARSEDVEAVLSRLKDVGYLNDRRFAESFASTRLQDQRLGRMRVLRDLRARRVAPAVAEQTVNRVYAGVDEDELINDYLRRKLRIDERPHLLAQDKALASAFRRLLRAGFSRGGSLRALKRYAADAAVLEGLEHSNDDTEDT
jgi:regulatory protein